MILIERKRGKTSDISGLDRDTISLGWEERRKSRQKLTTHSGMPIALALPTGSILEDGEIIYQDAERYVAVEAAPEDVLCLYPEHPEDYALAAYEIGNRHMPLSVGHGRLMTVYEPLLAGHFEKRGIRCEHLCIPFEPVKKGHSHG